MAQSPLTRRRYERIWVFCLTTARIAIGFTESKKVFARAVVLTSLFVLWMSITFFRNQEVEQTTLTIYNCFALAVIGVNAIEQCLNGGLHNKTHAETKL